MVEKVPEMCSLLAQAALLWLLCSPVPTLMEEQLFGEIFHHSRNLLTPHKETHKCHREVPAIFFQTLKGVPMVGNGSSIFFNSIEVCCEGYKRATYDWRQCVADCSHISPDSCRHGFCRTPRLCECYPEFVRNERGQCIHTCPISCQHGRCYLDGTCVCEPGYTLDPKTTQFCRPLCPQGCAHHQLCVAPGICDCVPGYRLTMDYGCQPVCAPDCGHGMCIGPNECQCFAGYIKRPGRNVCEAECYMPCENGFCESRYRCQCRDGFKFDESTRSCLPDCGEACENGVCLAPGQCRCFQGYELRQGVCEPQCLGGCGYFGRCVAPEVCGCVPSGLPCLNGSCLPNGKCRCPAQLTRFVGQCVVAARLEELLQGDYETRERLSRGLAAEFELLIGRFFQFEQK